MRAYSLAVALGWIALAAAGVYYARLKNVPAAIAAPLVAAFLVEYALYLVPGFERVRRGLAEKLPVLALAAALVASGLAPYLIYSLATGQFHPVALLRLFVLLAAISFWYVFREPRLSSDLAIVALLAAILLLKLFSQIYTSPAPDIRIEVLGQLALIRIAAMVMLTIREVDGVGFGFLPSLDEWKIGARYFVYFAAVGLPVALAIGLIRFQWSPQAHLAPILFLGFLWVVALSEEFFFRGLIQQWATQRIGSTGGLVLASALYGLAHISFRAFPNWKHAVVTTILGWFCGKAFLAGKGIRAAMVTHALAITLWRVMFV
ncbi:MAG: lysostaphin resistance A-like protein [Bryobacteraceae bacterium]